MTVWTATVPRPIGVPLDQVHVMLYAYFPSIGRGEARPYVWRLLAPDSIGLISAVRPTAATARPVPIQAGVTLDFTLTFKRVRQKGGSYVRPDGRRRARSHTAVTITSMPEMRDRLISYAAGRGGAIGYVRLDGVREVRVAARERTIRLPIADARGLVLVTDPDAFGRLLTTGGPGTGKAFGCGAWWVPALMDQSA